MFWHVGGNSQFAGNALHMQTDQNPVFPFVKNNSPPLWFSAVTKIEHCNIVATKHSHNLESLNISDLLEFRLYVFSQMFGGGDFATSNRERSSGLTGNKHDHLRAALTLWMFGTLVDFLSGRPRADSSSLIATSYQQSKCTKAMYQMSIKKCGTCLF